MKIQRLVFISLLAFSLASCEKRISLNISGSTTVLPIVSKAADQYKSINPDFHIVVNAGGSGVGINQLGEGRIEIGMASRQITRSEIDRFPQVSFNPISVGKDAVVPVVSSEVYDAGVKALTLEQIGKIYLGEINNWKDLGGPDREILCIDKESSRGTRHVFMEIVLHDKKAEAPGADLVLGSNNEEQTAISQSEGAIGMLSNAWLNEDVKGLGVIMSDGSIVKPTLSNIIDGKFPITRDLFIITDGDPRGEAKEFIEFLLGEQGQKIVEECGYVSVVR